MGPEQSNTYAAAAERPRNTAWSPDGTPALMTR